MADTTTQNVLVLDDEVAATSPADLELYTEYNENSYSQSNANILILDENRETGSALSDVLDGNKSQSHAAVNAKETGSSNRVFTSGKDGFEDDVDNELSPGGVLDEKTIGQGLSNLGRSADGTQQVFLHVTLPGFSLINIELLAEYVHLQKVEIPYNSLTDLTPLGYMPYLLELDASHNEITTLLDFEPPKNLKIVDLSFNKIEEMTDLSCFHYLQKLILDNNSIHEIKGIEKCHRLSHLSLVHNKIEQISGLHDLPIRFLNLRGNHIRKIENLDRLKYLQDIILSGNKIRSMNNLQNHDFLEHVDLEDNEIIDLSELQYVQELRMLRELNLQRNPIQELPDYRLSILFHLPRLTELDRHKVNAEEKVHAVNLFDPPMEVIAARDHIMNVMFAFRQPCVVLDSTLPSIETPYPMLVLVGPQGAGKKDLALKLTEEFPDYFGYGISHTTRKPYHEEVQGKDYHFVSLDEFEHEIKYGKFIQTYHNNGNFFGLTLEAVESVAREGLACVVHMELEGVLSLKKTYFEPRFVLIMPLSEEIHERRLRNRGIYTEEQIAWNLTRAQKYIEQNQDHPGFFDMFINSDDITESYWRLRRLVMDYLGISIPTPPQSSSGEQIEAKEAGGIDVDTRTSPVKQEARVWSKTSLNDSQAPQIQTTLRRGRSSPATAPAVMGRGIVEQESLKRRHSAAKNAVSGQAPSIYEQVLDKMPKTAPTSLYGINSLADSHETAQRSYSVPIMEKSLPKSMDEFQTGSPDSSTSSSGSSSSLSNLSEHSAIDRREMSDAGSPTPNELPDHTVERLELMSTNRTTQSPSGGVILPPPAPRPGTGGSRPASRSASAHDIIEDTVLPPQRPGSDKHKVLPPISPVPNALLPEY